MGTPRLSLTSITIGAPDPRALAEFYARLLGRPVTVVEGPGPDEPPEAGWAQVRTGDGPTLNFEYERRWQTPVWPAEADRPIAT